MARMVYRSCPVRQIMPAHRLAPGAARAKSNRERAAPRKEQTYSAGAFGKTKTRCQRAKETLARTSTQCRQISRNLETSRPTAKGDILIVSFHKPIRVLHCYETDYVVTLSGKVGKTSLFHTNLKSVYIYYEYCTDKEIWEEPDTEVRFKICARMETREEAVFVANSIVGLKPGSKQFMTKLALVADEVKVSDYPL